MKFLCDVHISYKIVRHIRSLGYEAIHINEILDRWHTKDADICTYADENNLIVLTKDADFKNSFLIRNTPKKLIKVNLGNISTSILRDLISENIEAFQMLDSKGAFMVELDQGSVSFIRKETQSNLSQSKVIKR
jgi:predicted nuclease of predicted toxin-antitoxin system